jgi:flagellar hook-associated protein 2
MNPVDTSSLFQFSGLASGLDTRSIIDVLVQVESIPLLRLQERKGLLSEIDKLFGTFDSSLDKILDALNTIKTPSDLRSYSASSSDESVLLASVSGSANPGSHSVTVLDLAQAESRASTGFADADTTDVGTGIFDVVVDGQNYTVDLTGNPANTLNDVRDAINASGAPVTATVIDNGQSVDPYQLVVTSSATGGSEAFDLDFSSSPGLGSSLGFTVIQNGQDAHIQVDGLDVWRPTNAINDVFEGLDLNLRSTGTSEVTVATDPAGMKAKLQGLVDTYNDLAKVLGSQFKVDENGQTSARLFGDSAVRGIQRQLRSAFTGAVSGLSGTYDNLASIGIRADSSGQLSIDDAAFDAALEADFDGVIDLFTNATNGLGQRIEATIGQITDPTNGVIKIRRDGIETRQRTLDTRIRSMQDRLSRYEERLVRRFAAFEELMSGFQAQGASLNFPS